MSVPRTCPEPLDLDAIEQRDTEWGPDLRALLAEVKRLRAQVAAVEALADDMDTWTSPYGISLTYAGRIRDALRQPNPTSEDTP